MVYPIDKSIPVPSTSVDISAYPFASMVVNDSFLVPFPTVDQQGKPITYTLAQKQSLQQVVARAARYHASTTSPRRSYITQITTTGVRCWRTNDVDVPNTTTA